MPKKGRGLRGTGNQSSYAKAKETAKNKEKYDNARNQIGCDTTVFIYERKRDPHNFHGMFIQEVPDKYLCLSYGTTAVMDAESKEIVLIVSFSPFCEMDPEEGEELEKLTSSLKDLKKGAYNVKGNGAHKRGNGDMYALGWRWYYNEAETCGRYAPSAAMQRKNNLLKKWEDDQDTVTWISDLYCKRFSNLASKIFQQTSEEAIQACIPDLGQTEFVDLQQVENVFASNLTYSMEDFCNFLHQDNDYNTYIYGLWAPTDSEDGNLARQSDGFKCDGGEFIVSSYGVSVDFGNCDGVVEIIWRGSNDFHATLPSTTAPGFTRIGTSVQINNNLVREI